MSYKNYCLNGKGSPVLKLNLYCKGTKVHVEKFLYRNDSSGVR